MTKTKITILSVVCPRKDCDAPEGMKCRKWVVGRGYVSLKRAHSERVRLTER